MSATPRTCSSCGAQVPADANRCDLCGTPVGASSDDRDRPDDATDSPTSNAGAETRGSPPESEEETGPSVFCNQCGWENPPGARFCSQCGTELQDLSDAAPVGTRLVEADLPTKEKTDESESSPDPQETDEQVAMGRQIVLVVGGALFLVFALFFVTQWSAQYEWSGNSSTNASAAQAGPEGNGASPSGNRRSMSAPARGGRGAPTRLQALLDQTADSIPGSMAGQVDSLRARIGQASKEEKRRLRAELVNLLIGAGQPGRAAVVQKKIADATGDVEARRRTADLLYRWMQKLQGEGQRKQVLQVARHAAKAYEKVVEKRPNDLDARTRMGETYLLTNEPMRGIKAINAVLEDDSTFVPARFQKGLALLQINRLDQAVRQFKKVKRYAEEGSPFYRQADRALTVIREQRGKISSGTPSSGRGANP